MPVDDSAEEPIPIPTTFSPDTPLPIGLPEVQTTDDLPTRRIPVTRYVSTTGSDIDNDCTNIADPCETVQKAVQQANSGDTIQIAAGTYEDTNVEIQDSETKSLTFIGAGMTQTILDGNRSSRIFSIFSANSPTTISDLTAQNGYYGSYGGGIMSHSELTLTRVKVTGNEALYGGGGIYIKENFTFTDVEVSGNTGRGSGGGIKAELDSDENGTLNRVTIVGNDTLGTDTYGGGVYLIEGDFTLTNVTISGNSADDGSEMSNMVVGANTQLLNVTISGGEGDSAVYNNASISFKNTIVGGNCNHEGASWVSDGNNLETGSTCNFTQSGDLQNTDPLLGALADNGGYTSTHALQKGSPAIDAGNNSGCPSTDQRGETRPKDGDADGTATCDIGTYEYEIPIITVKFRSTAAYDGWVRESSETSSTGGSKDASATTLQVGDDSSDRQYRAILSFDTSTLPDDAVVTSAVLKVKRKSLIGTDPFTTHGKLKVDMRKGFFGTAKALQVTDFEATTSKSAVKAIPNTPVNNWYKVSLPTTAFTYIHLKIVTQFRLRFQTGDDDDLSADAIKFYSGDHATESVRPLLIIKYYVP